jgi:hypothetical protein
MSFYFSSTLDPPTRGRREREREGEGSDVFGFIVLEVLSQHLPDCDGPEEIESADERHNARDLDRDQHIATYVFVRPLGTASELRLEGEVVKKKAKAGGKD